MHNKRFSMVILSVIALLALTGCNLLSLMTAQAPENTPLPEQNQNTVTENQMTTLPDQSGILSALQTALETIYTNVNPSVVSVQVTQQNSGAVLPFSEESAQPYEQGAGSGFVWDNQGHIVTNYHVIENATRIVVRFADDTTAEATIVGSDPDSDLAVLKVDVAASQLQPVRIAQTEPAVGQLSVAIGNPFGLENTMTVGFISAIGRSLSVGETLGSRYSIPDIIQTDAPINPGNSGGVLVNEKGEVIGVTAAIISPVQASVGIGFAIPAAIVERVVPVLIETGAYAHPWIGISGTTLTADLAEAMELPADQRGALVIDVIANSPAEQGGVRGSTRQMTLDGAQASVGGDVIIALDATPIHSFEDLISALSAQTRPGQTVVLTVLRDGAERELRLTLGERPKS